MRTQMEGSIGLKVQHCHTSLRIALDAGPLAHSVYRLLHPPKARGALLVEIDSSWEWLASL